MRITACIGAPTPWIDTTRRFQARIAPRSRGGLEGAKGDGNGDHVSVLLVAARGLVGEQLVRLTIDGRRVLNEEKLAQRIGRIRDVRQGPDGFIYVAVEDRQGAPTAIWKLEPAGN